MQLMQLPNATLLPFHTSFSVTIDRHLSVEVSRKRRTGVRCINAEAHFRRVKEWRSGLRSL